MVLQDTWLFGGTIRDNIAYGNPDATEEQILEAARATYVDRFVHSLPDGYDTMINEEGDNISAGQKQLLTIARAFLADPAILILDEATSSVDTRTEVLIQEAMNALRANRTSFVIAHRLSTIRGADVILVMENGRIVEQGSHDELLGHDGAYSRLYNSQFAGAGRRGRVMDPTAADLAAIDRDGYVVIERAVGRDVLDAIRAELAPYLDGGADSYRGRNDFEGYDTNRVYGLLAKSRPRPSSSPTRACWPSSTPCSCPATC